MKIGLFNYVLVMKITIFVLCLAIFDTYAQITRQLDTTYTIESAFLKMKGNYADLSIAQEIQSEKFEAKKNVIYAGYGTNELKFDAFYDKSKHNLPGIVLIHGGGWKSGSRQMLNPMAQRLTLKGYQTFTISYRLSGDAQYPAAIIDIESALAFLAKASNEYNLDKDKISILGCSAGAQMATLVGLKNSKKDQKNSAIKIRSIVNVDGLMDFLDKDAEEGSSAEKWLGGSANQKREIWREASPVNYINPYSPPVLFVHGNQKRFQAGRITALEQMNKYKIYNETVSIDAPHTFWLFEPWQDELVIQIDQFFKKVN